MKRRHRSRAFRAALLALAGLACLLGWYLGREWYWDSNPEAAFVTITGRELPPGVHVDTYTTVRSGAFRKAYFWTLSGEAEAIRQFGKDLGLERSREDARLVFSNPRELANLPSLAGLEGRRYIVLRDGTEALYVHY